MRQRTVVMYVEIGCFVSCLFGWVLICSTLVIEYWIITEDSTVVLTTSDFYSNLWMDCIADNTGASDCKYFPSMMDLPVFLHVSRALAVVSVIFGFWGAVLALVGMKCTKIGGSELANSRVTFAAALTYMASGLSGMIVYCLWGEKTRTDFLDPYLLDVKYEYGAALFIGWGGSCLLLGGSAVMCFFSWRESFPKRLNKHPRKSPTYISARTRRTYMLPGSSRPTTVFIPPSHSYSGSRGTRASGERRGTQESQSSMSIRPILPLIDSAV